MQRQADVGQQTRSAAKENMTRRSKKRKSRQQAAPLEPVRQQLDQRVLHEALVHQLDQRVLQEAPVRHRRVRQEGQHDQRVRQEAPDQQRVQQQEF